MSFDEQSLTIKIQAILDDSQISTAKISGATQDVAALQTAIDQLQTATSSSEDSAYLTTLSTGLTNTLDVLNNISAIATSVGSQFADAWRLPLQQMMLGVRETMKSFQRFSKEVSLNPSTQRDHGIQNYRGFLDAMEASNRIKLMQHYSGSAVPFLGGNFNQFASVFMSRMLTPRIKEISPLFKGNADISRYITHLSQDGSIRKFMEAHLSPGHALTDEQVSSTIGLVLSMYPSAATQQIAREAVKHLPSSNQRVIYNSDRFTDAFRSAIFARGRIDVDTASLAGKGVDTQIWKQVRDYVERHDQSGVLGDILKRANLMTVEKGRRYWASAPTALQLSYLGGLSAESLYDALRGYTFYDKNPSAQENDQSLLRHNNKRITANLGLQQILSNVNGYTPSVNIDPRSLPKFNIETRVRGGKLDTTGSIEQYVVPRTIVDFETGEQTARDVNWRKHTGFSVRDDDEFVAISDSALFDMIKQSQWGKKNGFIGGHGTFGFGRNDDGTYKTGVFPIVQISTRDWFQENEEGKFVVNERYRQQIEDVLSRGRTYNGSHYSAISQNSQSGVVTFLLDDVKKEFEDNFRQAGLASVFEGLLYGGLESADPSRLVKTINYVRKIQSDSVNYEEQFGQFQQDGERLQKINQRIFNTTAWYDAMEKIQHRPIEKRERWNGSVFGSPDLFRNGSVQMRSVGGFGKYVLTPLRFQQLLRSSLYDIPLDQVDGDSYNGNMLITSQRRSKKAKKIDLWLPGQNATTEEVLTLWDPQYNPQMSQQERRSLRDRKFFRATDDAIHMLLTDEAVKADISHMPEANYKQFKKDPNALALAQKQGRVKDGIVELTPEEQGDYAHAITMMTGGYRAMKTSSDFASTHGLVAQQTAGAMGITQDTLERSNRNYQKRIDALRTLSGQYQALSSDPYYAQKLKEDPGFLFSSEARSFIETEIQGYEDSRRNGYLNLESSRKLAAVTPFVLTEIARGLLPHTQRSKSPYANSVQQYMMPSAMNHVKNQEFEAQPMSYIFAQRDFSDGELAMLNRLPDSTGQRVAAINLLDPNNPLNPQVTKNKRKTQKNINKLRRKQWRLGIGKEEQNTLFVDPSTMYQFNTGDFDGDTIQATYQLSRAQFMQMDRIQKEYKIASERYETLRMQSASAAVPTQQLSVAQGKLQALGFALKGVRLMGAASAALRNAMDLPDDDPRKWVAVAEAQWAYDQGTSDVQAHGSDVSLPDNAAALVISQGGTAMHFSQQLRKLAAERSDSHGQVSDEIRTKVVDGLLKASLPSLYNSESVLAASLRAVDSNKGRTTDEASFQKMMQDMLSDEYGALQTPEAEASRWYAQMMQKNLYGRLLTTEDLKLGQQLQSRWLHSINSRAGNVSESEMQKFDRFGRRQDYAYGKTSFTEANIYSLLQELQSGPITEVEQGRIQALQNLLSYNQQRNAIIMNQNIEQIEDEEERRRIQEAQSLIEAERQAKQQQISSRYKGSTVWNKTGTNWSTLKGWINPNQIQGITGQVLSIATGTSTSDGEQPIEIGGPSDYFGQKSTIASSVIARMLGKQERDYVSQIIGDSMHKGFEEWYRVDPATGVFAHDHGKETLSDIYVQMLGHPDSALASNLRAHGLAISYDATAKRFNLDHRAQHQTSVERLASFLPTQDNQQTTIAMTFLETLKKQGLDIEHPFIVEGQQYIYDQSGKITQRDVSRNIPFPISYITQNGNPATDVTKTTHQKFDLVLPRLKADGTPDWEDLSAIDYKSSMHSAYHAMPQMMFYAALSNRMAQQYYELSEKQANGTINPEELQMLTAAETFKDFGHMENGRFVPHIKRGISYSGLQGGHIVMSDFLTGRNKEIVDNMVSIMQDAAASMRVDAMELGPDSPFFQALLTEAADKTADQEAIEKRKSLTSGPMAEAAKGLSQQERDYFLTKYNQDLDQLRELRSAIYKEERMRGNAAGLHFRGQSRAAIRDMQLREIFGDEVTAAYLANFPSESGVYNDVDRTLAEKIKQLQRNEDLGVNAATADWVFGQRNLTKSIYGIEDSNLLSIFSYAQKLRDEALSSRDFLIGIQKTPNGKKEPVSLLTPKFDSNHQIIGYQVNPDVEKTNLNQEAQRMLQHYNESLSAEHSFNQTLENLLPVAIQADSKQKDARWRSLTGETQSAEESLQSAITAKKEAIVKEVATYTMEIQALSEAIAKGNFDENTQKILQQAINELQDRINAVNKFLNSHEADQVAIRDRRKELGMDQEASAQIQQKRFDDLGAVAKNEDEKEAIEQEHQAQLQILQNRGANDEIRLNAMAQNQGLTIDQRVQIAVNDRKAQLQNYIMQHTVDKSLGGKANTGYEQAVAAARQMLEENVQADFENRQRQREQEQAAVDLAQADLMQSRANVSGISQYNQLFQQMYGQRNMYGMTMLSRNMNMRQQQMYGFQGQYLNSQVAMQANDNEIAKLKTELEKPNVTPEQKAHLSEQLMATQMNRENLYALQDQLGSRIFMPDMSKIPLQGALQNSKFGAYFGNQQQYQTQTNNRLELLKTAVQLRNDEISKEQIMKQRDEANANGNVRLRNSYDAIIKGFGDNMDKTGALKAAQSEIAGVNQEMSQFGAVGAIFSGTVDTIRTSLVRMGTMFVRRIFNSMIRETTQFVKQYDKNMRTIQAITLKTDEEMKVIGAETVTQAVALKTDTNTMGTVKADLYRQGLNDAQVNERAAAIVKFATVTGAKVTEAGKAITTAMQNDLVSSAEEAMDVLTALGDTAATTAEQIFKGMQKSAAAAKQAGVSYDELTAMLTVITSKTQLGGTQAGTMLQTLFSRMSRVTKAGYVNAESGDTSTLNDVQTALGNVGISLLKPGSKTEMRDFTEVLRDLAKVWNELNDIQRGNITYAMAGGRNVNMFTTQMEGLAEDDGAEFDRLLGIAANSEGTTQSKYEIAVGGLNGALTELKSTWDALVQSLTETGWLQELIEGVTQFVAGIKAITDGSSGWAAAFKVMRIAAEALIAKLMIAEGFKQLLGGDVLGLGQIAGGIAVGGIAVAETEYAKGLGDTELENIKAQTGKKESVSAASKKIDSQVSYVEKVRDNAQSILDKYTDQPLEIGSADYNYLQQQILTLTQLMPGLAEGIDDVTSRMEQWAKILHGADDAVKDLKAQSVDFMIDAAEENAQKVYEDAIKQIESAKPIDSDILNAIQPSSRTYYRQTEEGKRIEEAKSEYDDVVRNNTNWANGHGGVFNYEAAKADGVIIPDDMLYYDDYGNWMTREEYVNENSDDLNAGSTYDRVMQLQDDGYSDSYFEGSDINLNDFRVRVPGGLKSYNDYVQGLGLNQDNAEEKIIEDTTMSLDEFLKEHGANGKLYKPISAPYAIRTSNGQYASTLQEEEDDARIMVNSQGQLSNLLATYLSVPYAKQYAKTYLGDIFEGTNLNWDNVTGDQISDPEIWKKIYDKQFTNEDVWQAVNSWQAIASTVTTSTINDLIKSYMSDDVYGPAMKLLGYDADNEALVTAVQRSTVDKIKKETENMTEEEATAYVIEQLDPKNAVEQLFGTLGEDNQYHGGIFTNQTAAELMAQSLSPNEFHYSYRDENGNLLFGFEENTEEGFNEAQDAAMKAETDQNSDRYKALSALQERIQNGSFDFYNDHNTYNNKTGLRQNPTFGEAVSDAAKSIKAKDRKYDAEYLAMLAAITGATENNVFDYSKYDASLSDLPNKTALLGDDMELTQILNSQSKGDGKYSSADLISHLVNKVYGSSRAIATGNLGKSAYSLAEQEADLKALQEGNLTSAQRGRIAQALGIDVGQFNQNHEFWGGEYSNLVETNQDALMRSATQKVLNDLKLNTMQTTDENGESLVTDEAFNSEAATLQSLGFTQTKDSNGALTLQYNGTSYDQYADLKNYDAVYTGTQRAANAAAVLRALEESPSKTWNEIVGTVDDLTEESWEDLKKNNADLYTYLNMDEEQRASQEGQNLYRKITTQIEVEGVQQLEEAGIVAEGTMAAIEKLRKGGKVAIEVTLSAQVEGFNAQQLMAQLKNGTPAEQWEAIKQITGYTDQLIQAKGLDQAKSDAKTLLNATLQQNAASQQAELNALEGDAQTNYANTLRQIGYNVRSYEDVINEAYFNGDTQTVQALIAEAEALGMSFDLDQITKGNSKSKTLGYSAKKGSPTRYVVEAPQSGDYVYANAYKSAEEKYTNRQIAEFIGKALAGDWEDFDKYSSVIQGAGLFNVDKYLWLQQQGLFSENDEDHLRIRERAQQEASVYTLQALESEGAAISGLSDQVNKLTSESSEERRQGLSSGNTMGETAENVASAWALLGSLSEEDWYMRSGSAIETLASIFGWSNEERKRYSRYDERDNLKKYIGDYLNTMTQAFQNSANAIASAFGINLKQGEGQQELQAQLQQLGDAGNAAAAGMANLIAIILNIPKIGTGAQSVTTGDIFTSARENGNYNTTQNSRRVKNALAQMAMSGVYENKEQFIQTAINQGVFKTAEEADAFFKNNSDWANIVEEYDTTGNWDVFKNKAIEASDYAAGNSDYNEFALQEQLYRGLFNDDGEYNGGLNALINGENGERFVAWMSDFEAGAVILEKLQNNVAITNEEFREFDAELSGKSIRLMKQYGDHTDDVAEAVVNLSKGGAKASTQVMKLEAEMMKYNDIATAISKARGKTGAQLDEQTRGIIASNTDFSEQQIQAMGADALGSLLDNLDIVNQANANASIGDTIAAMLAESINQSGLDLGTINAAVGFDVTAEGGIDASQIGVVAQLLKNDVLGWLAAFGGEWGTLIAEVDANGDRVTAIGKYIPGSTGGYSSKAGGGGGGKTEAKKLLEKLKREKELSDHRLKMLQYTEKFYEGRGELTNVNSLLGQENELRGTLIDEYTNHISQLREQMKKTTKGSDDWYSLAESILSYEEAIEECNNAIDENTRKIEENWQAIRKTRTALEGTVDTEIKARIQRERDMLDGTVEMENQILEAIKNRYSEEWSLIVKDIEKKKQALEEEKRLIDERLNKRKEAEDEAEKYEELAELRRQYALISMDSTRTKDAAELREKIAELEKEIAWDLAEDEARAQEESLQDQMDAYDEYQQNGQEDLDALLANANNFADEMNSVLRMSQEDLLNWMAANVREYANSVLEAQKQMARGWVDTWKKMMGITDTWWPEIDEILSSKDTFLDYMKESQTYINASDTDKEVLLYDWGKAYDDYVNARKAGAYWEHEDEFNEGLIGGSGGGNGSGANNSNGGDSEAAMSLWRVAGTYYKDGQAYPFKQQVEATSATEAANKAKLAVVAQNPGLENIVVNSITPVPTIGTGISSGGSATNQSALAVDTNAYRTMMAYSEGGLVDYTGTALVHGSKLHPEAFLSAEDTAMIRGWLDAAKYITVNPNISRIDSSNFNRAGFTVGDIHISINEASFKDDADIEAVAERVGQAFVKQISKQGLMTANYAF